jgi:flagellar export protein FliJ
MGQFRFRLDRVRRVREQQQRQAEQAVAGSRLAVRQGREDLQAVERAAAQVRLRCAREGAGPLCSSRLLSASRHLELLGGKEASHRIRLAAAEADLREKREKLLAAMQAREMLDRLRQARLREHGRGVAAAEDRERDATVTSRWTRQPAVGVRRQKAA